MSYEQLEKNIQEKRHELLKAVDELNKSKNISSEETEEVLDQKYAIECLRDEIEDMQFELDDMDGLIEHESPIQDNETI